MAAELLFVYPKRELNIFQSPDPVSAPWLFVLVRSTAGIYYFLWSCMLRG